MDFLCASLATNEREPIDLTVCIPAIRCEPLRPLINGTILGTEMLYGAVVRYRCNVGFRMEGPEKRTCQADGTWSDSEPTCPGELIMVALCNRADHYIFAL